MKKLSPEYSSVAKKQMTHMEKRDAMRVDCILRLPGLQDIGSRMIDSDLVDSVASAYYEAVMDPLNWAKRIHMGDLIDFELSRDLRRCLALANATQNRGWGSVPLLGAE